MFASFWHMLAQVRHWFAVAAGSGRTCLFMYFYFSCIFAQKLNSHYTVQEKDRSPRASYKVLPFDVTVIDLH